MTPARMVAAVVEIVACLLFILSIATSSGTLAMKLCGVGLVILVGGLIVTLTAFLHSEHLD